MAKSEPQATPRINLAASVRDLLHDVRLIRNSLDAHLDRLDRIETELKALVPRRAAGARKTVLWDAGPVANNLVIQPRPDGSVVFAIDSGKRFSLAPRLAEVFRFLASGEKDRSGRDALVGWRSRMEIIGYLEKRSGQPFRQNYLNGMVYLLRKALRKAGYDQKLIQTHRRKGIRMAYKRGAQGSPPPWPNAPSSLL